jgi:hypothetical protein
MQFINFLWDFRFSDLITLMMEAGSTSGKSVKFYQTTWRNILKDSHLQNLFIFSFAI